MCLWLYHRVYTYNFQLLTLWFLELNDQAAKDHVENKREELQRRFLVTPLTTSLLVLASLLLSKNV